MTRAVHGGALPSDRVSLIDTLRPNSKENGPKQDRSFSIERRPTERSSRHGRPEPNVAAKKAIAKRRRVLLVFSRAAHAMRIDRWRAARRSAPACDLHFYRGRGGT